MKALIISLALIVAADVFAMTLEPTKLAVYRKA